jgi:hypothetical protein
VKPPRGDRGRGSPGESRSRWWKASLGSTWLLLAGDVLAAGGKPAKKLVNVADTRDLGSGVVRWIADVYNTNLWLYGLLVVVVMAAMGVILGFGVDRLMGVLGIDLGKMEHHE